MTAGAFDHNPEPMSLSMDESTEAIKHALLAEYDQLGTIDVAGWVTRYPAHRDEIIDFWMWVKGTPRATDFQTGPFPTVDVDIAEQALRNACLSVNLGPQWLEATVDPTGAVIDEMARELEALRAKPQLKGGKAPTAFRKAVVSTWVVSRLQARGRQVSRLAVQKTTYILENAMLLGVFVEHGRKPLGPYDHKARYKDAEPIAMKKGWLEVRGAALRTTGDLVEVKRFVGRYVRSERLAERLIDYLGRLSDDELETLATIHWVASELTKAGRPLTVADVTDVLAHTPEWRSKLRRAGFTEDCLATALLQLNELGLAPPS